jgi:hypothetical protein
LTLSRRSVRLADGGRQPCAVPSLATLGLDHAHGADLRAGATGAPDFGADGQGGSGLPGRAPVGDQAHLPAHGAPPAWVFLNVPMVDVSSTEIRARGDW